MNETFVRPVRNDEDMDIALARLDEIFEPAFGTPEADEAEVLTVLIEAYERERYPVSSPGAVPMILAVMEQKGLRPRDLIPFMGASSRVSEVLNGKRKLTVEMIRNLSRGLGIPADALLD